MELRPCEKFLLSDSDDSDVETMLATFRQQTLVMALAVKEHEDEHQKRRQGFTVGRVCIPRNRYLGNEMLMQDYFMENPTYPPHLFRRRYRMGRPLFVKLWHPGSKQPVYLALPAQRSSLLATDNNMVQKQPLY